VTSALAQPSRIAQISQETICKKVNLMSASYRDLRVWQNAMDLVERVYGETRSFPREELYGLTSQMRRAAVSIPSNIAEGKGRSTDRDRSLFFCHARGSLLELETQVLIAQRLKYLTPPRTEALINLSAELGRMLNSLIQSMRSPESTTRSATREKPQVPTEPEPKVRSLRFEVKGSRSA
jgi:four helix bundle protein